MKKIGKTAATIAVMLAAISMLGGCLDEDYEDYEYSEDYSQEYEYPETQEEYASDESGSDYSAPASGELTTGNYPMGTVGELEGTIAVVTIIASDANGAWDPDSQKCQSMFAKYRESMPVDLDWVKKSAAEYGREVNFIWDWEEHEELLYEASFETDLANTINTDKEGIFEADEIIANTIDSASIMSSLNADGIVYYFFVYENEGMKCRPCTFNVGTGISDSQKDYWYYMEGREEPPYEFIILLSSYEEDYDDYAVIAHEFIHTLGAPDLYAPSWFGITQELVDYMDSTKSHDIMLDKYPPFEITDITAYYAGLTDYSETAKEWGLDPSSHDK